MVIIPRHQHAISRKKISQNAIKVLYRLNKAGYEAYLVGGSVRDLLLGKRPKDFDITTNATPEQMKKLFRNCRLIGRRFRLAHIIFKSEIIEVSTFRGYNTMSNILSKNTTYSNNISNTNIVLTNNIFGSIEDDAQRRDFSINSLYYNIKDFTLRDYTNGIQDLKNGIIRLLGNPSIRYQEDPVRMLRAIRFSAKLNMKLSYETAEPIPRLGILLNQIPPARLFEETLKLLQSGYAEITYRLLRQYQLFRFLFPLIDHSFHKQNHYYLDKMLIYSLSSADNYFRNGMQVNAALLFAPMLWYPLLEWTKKINKEKNLPYLKAFLISINYILNEQCHTLAIPKRFTMIMRDMWQAQFKLTNLKKNNMQFIYQPKLDAAHYLLVLRSKVENDIQ